MKHVISVLLILIGVAYSQEKYKMCAPETVIDSSCNALQRSRGTSQVSCQRVTDSVECALKIAEGKADFGIFNAEEMLLAYQFFPEQLKVITSLRHPDRINEDFEFQTVAVVPALFDGRDGLASLKSGGFCHPGFSESQTWNDLILKTFEKKVYDAWCRSDVSASENEAQNLRNFFGSTCRPGEWVSDSAEDLKLKSHYPELCALCDNKDACTYKNMTHHGHFGALDCLVSGRGKVAYVAYDYVKQYFPFNASVAEVMSVPIGFQFLCEDGTTRPLTSKNPCAWVKQPWSGILARKDTAPKLLEELKGWLGTNDRAQEWTSALKSIIEQSGKVIHHSNTQQMDLKTYLAGREVALPKFTCGENIRWCTVGEPETNKCNWAAKEALALGIEPGFTCALANSTFDCLRNIANNKADIIVIDSNYGYVARQVFNLTTIMYTETDIDRNSEVIAVVLENPSVKISSFQELRKKTACFPEYGGIAWLSLLNTLRTSKIIADSCDYAGLVSEFLSGACAPGLKDADHSITPISSDASTILCSLCPIEQTNATCSANEDNDYYGDKGALRCLKRGAGNVAFVEAKNLKGEIDGKAINPNEYRVLCKNGSLATYTGFDVDEQCALSVTIDSEVVSRKDNSDIFKTDVTLALLKIEDWLGYHTDFLRPMRIYDSSTENSDLLFKDSTVGLVPTKSDIKTVLAYEELFSHVDSCSSVDNIVANILTIFLAASVTFAVFQ